MGYAFGLSALGPSRHARSLTLVQLRDHGGCPTGAPDLVDIARAANPDATTAPVTAATGTGVSGSERSVRATAAPPTTALIQCGKAAGSGWLRRTYPGSPACTRTTHPSAQPQDFPGEILTRSGQFSTLVPLRRS